MKTWSKIGLWALKYGENRYFLLKKGSFLMIFKIHLLPAYCIAHKMRLGFCSMDHKKKFYRADFFLVAANSKNLDLKFWVSKKGVKYSENRYFFWKNAVFWWFSKSISSQHVALHPKCVWAFVLWTKRKNSIEPIFI